MASLKSKNSVGLGQRRVAGNPISGTAERSFALVEPVSKGFTFNSIKKLAESSGFIIKDILEMIGMSERTYERRRVAGKLTTDESDRLVRVKRLYDMAFEVFGDKAAASGWFKRPRPAFGGLTPMEMAKTETGGREVERLLGDLAHGVLY